MTSTRLVVKYSKGGGSVVPEDYPELLQICILDENDDVTPEPILSDSWESINEEPDEITGHRRRIERLNRTARDEYKCFKRALIATAIVSYTIVVITLLIAILFNKYFRAV